MKNVLRDDLRDIQGIVSRGYKNLNSARYILLKIDDCDHAKLYFKQLRPFITSADKMSYERQIKGDPAFALQIAFTYTGLEQLKLPPHILQTFPREFIEGIADRAQRSLLLGDTGPNDPTRWEWGLKEKTVDCLIMLFAEDDAQMAGLLKVYFNNINQGVTAISIEKTYEYNPFVSKEHFGFDDGISQPLIKGFSKSESEENPDNLINTGEFILGHKNEYNNYSPSPYLSRKDDPDDLLKFLPGSSKEKDLGKNGAFLVHRKMEQHVLEFWKYMLKFSREDGTTVADKAVKLASKMVGRWPNGQPLVVSPEAPDNSTYDIERFNYFEEDKCGLRCPFGAHIRRTNPRDQIRHINDKCLSQEMVRKHRMLRRARAYGNPLAPNMDISSMIAMAAQELEKDKSLKKDDCEQNDDIRNRPHEGRGLHFFCIVSDISRQFEFIQSVWSNTSTFAYLCNEVDPITSPRPTQQQPECREFTSPALPVRNRYLKVPQFTTVVGGAYYFMPGLKALDYIIK